MLKNTKILLESENRILGKSFRLIDGVDLGLVYYGKSRIN